MTNSKNSNYETKWRETFITFIECHFHLFFHQSPCYGWIDYVLLSVQNLKTDVMRIKIEKVSMLPFVAINFRDNRNKTPAEEGNMYASNSLMSDEKKKTKTCKQQQIFLK